MAEGFEEIETVTPIDYLRCAGAEVTFAATGSVNRTVMGAHGIPVTADTTLDAYLARRGNCSRRTARNRKHCKMPAGTFFSYMK
ncbi:MAG: DJ-1/PfpI family protein [Treponema sp.]|nr:DJ-1/PfpI family protein [Treponema sp.]